MKFISFLVSFLLCANSIMSHPGIGILENSKGVIFYTDLKHVWKIYPDGRKERAVTDIHTHKLYMDMDDNLYGTHEWYKGERTDKWFYYKWRLSAEGGFEKISPDIEGSIENDGLIRDVFGNEYWSEKNGEKEVLMKSSNDGNAEEALDHKFDDIRWLSLSYNRKDIYVVDRLDVYKVEGGQRLKTICNDLKENSKAFLGVGDHHYLMGVWDVVNGRTFVAVFGGQKVEVIEASGEQRTLYKSDKDWSPCGGFSREDGSQVILEFSRNNEARVIQISKDGEVKVL